MNSRSALFIVNASKSQALAAASELSQLLSKEGFDLFSVTELEIPELKLISQELLSTIEIAVVFGGDGTILRAAQEVFPHKIPLLGINLGHVGFLAEVERPSLADVAKSIIEKSYSVEKRMALKYRVMRAGSQIATGWALNEVTVERDATTMVELFVQIDNRPLSRWGCDGVICSTPTGSTAYAFSAGGPVLWPEIDALVLLPISAHALFSRPMVVAAQSEIGITIESLQALLSADSLRKFELAAGDEVLITKDTHLIKLAHVNTTLFTDRLVAKFKLPVEGWRGE